MGIRDSVILDADLSIATSRRLTIQNGLTLGASNPLITFLGGFSEIYATGGSMAIGGTGTIELSDTTDSNTIRAQTTGTTLTIGSNVTI